MWKEWVKVEGLWLYVDLVWPECGASVVLVWCGVVWCGVLGCVALMVGD